MEQIKILTGGTDQRGEKVLHVYWSMKNYTIYHAESGISVQFSDDDELADKQKLAYGEIGSLLSSIMSDLNLLRLIKARVGSKILKPANQQVARAIALALNENTENAMAILTTVQKELSNLKNVRAQLYHQLGSLLVVIVTIIAVNLYAESGGFFCSNYCVSDSETRLGIIAYGAMGGFLSILMGRKKQLYITGAYFSRLANILGGASRIIIAIIGSVIVYLVIQSKLNIFSMDIFHYVRADCHSIYLISIAAGFSETLAPNFLQKVTDKISTKPTTPSDRVQ